jgi:hypothetical protein
MKTIVGFVILLLILTISTNAKTPTPRAPQLNLPPSTQTVSPEMNYRLGEQSGKLNDILSRLDKMEPSLTELRRDVDRLNTIGLIVSAILTLIVAPLIVGGVNRWLAKREAASSS